jgi:hypothetical protein
MAWSQRKNIPVQIVASIPLETEHKSPSEQCHTSVRAMHYEIKRKELRNQTSTIQERVKGLDLKREELLRIDGYYVDPDGNMINRDELHALQLANNQGIAVTFFNLNNFKSVKPEKAVDMVNSLGEEYIPLDSEGKEIEYPNMDIRSGVVLRDKKIKHVDPALRRAEPRMYLDAIT